MYICIFERACDLHCPNSNPGYFFYHATNGSVWRNKNIHVSQYFNSSLLMLEVYIVYGKGSIFVAF